MTTYAPEGPLTADPIAMVTSMIIRKHELLV